MTSHIQGEPLVASRPSCTPVRVQSDDVLLPSVAAIEDVAFTIHYAGLTPSPEALAKIARLEYVRPLLSPAPLGRGGQAKLLSFAPWPVGTTPSEVNLSHAVLTVYLLASCRNCRRLRVHDQRAITPRQGPS